VHRGAHEAGAGFFFRSCPFNLGHFPNPVLDCSRGLSRFQGPAGQLAHNSSFSQERSKRPSSKKFKETGGNGYRDDADAIADGKELYTPNCIVCHGADGTCKIGPTIIGKDAVYKQVLTDPGIYAIMYGAVSGAMQWFDRRGTKQDEMLRIIAYVRALDK
jgi:cytochrome c-L